MWVVIAAPCKDGDGVVGPASGHCTTDGGKPSAPAPETSLDPLSELARSFAKAAEWISHQLGKQIESPHSVDLTNATFIKQYAVVFAASSVLVLLLWLLGVSKRAVRGVPLTTAIGEAVGLLWLSVAVTAFAPLILFSVIGATSAVTQALVDGLGAHPGGLFAGMGSDLTEDKLGGGPVILLIVSTVTILLCGALWLLMVLRALSLYVGAILGVVVFSGLVNRDWWGHARRWSGIMIALILIEPIMVIILGFSAALETGHGHVLTGITVSLLALGVAYFMITKMPVWGDATRAAWNTGRTAGRAAVGTARAAGGAVSGVMGGIEAHGGRPDGGRSSSTSVPKQSSGAAGGMSAHANRTPRDKKK